MSGTYGDSAVLIQAALVTGYGGRKVRDWANAAETSVACAVQPLRSTEETSGRQVITTDKALHTAPETPITAVDRVRWRGGTYEVTGVELHFMSGTPDHIEATLSLIEEPAV